MLNYAELYSAFSALELQANPVIVHSSLKNFGPIAGGAETVIRALQASTRGVMAPTFTYLTMVTPQVGPPNNGLTYGKDKDLNKMAIPFHKELPPDKMMGSLPRRLLEMEGAQRSTHPILSFGGLGVDDILKTHTLL